MALLAFLRGHGDEPTRPAGGRRRLGDEPTNAQPARGFVFGPSPIAWAMARAIDSQTARARIDRDVRPGDLGGITFAWRGYLPPLQRFRSISRQPGALDSTVRAGLNQALPSTIPAPTAGLR